MRARIEFSNSFYILFWLICAVKFDSMILWYTHISEVNNEWKPYFTTIKKKI